MSVKINYELRGGHWNPKDEIKVSFYKDLHEFITRRYDSDLRSVSLAEFIHYEPYIIGNLAGKYFLEEVVGGKLEDQSPDFFVGYCVQEGKYLPLLKHLIEFFAYWREIEQCSEEHATDFFANAWASLVDTAKLFKYTTVEDLENSVEAPSVRHPIILRYLQNVPGLYEAPLETKDTEDVYLPNPRKRNYEFLGWFLDPECETDQIHYAPHGLSEDVTYFALWGTHTLFHSNDGYTSFDELYSDFIQDFNDITSLSITKDVERIPGHGLVSSFCKYSYNGALDRFFSEYHYYKKWWWLIDYLRSNQTNEETKSHFNFKNGTFGLEAQVRWELNSLFVGRFHLIWPKTRDYSGVGIKEKLADSTNSSIIKMKYAVGEEVPLPTMKRAGFKFIGWWETPEASGEQITLVNDDRYAAKTLYAKWEKE